MKTPYSEVCHTRVGGYPEWTNTMDSRVCCSVEKTFKLSCSRRRASMDFLDSRLRGSDTMKMASFVCIRAANAVMILEHRSSTPLN